ncbi:MAG: sigmaK-factor processing regulatory BofA [Methanomicrobiales archaeon]|nr:sigmaK-factor processing regulatory BofA [Methanomicrobiales archaeon]
MTDVLVAIILVVAIIAIVWYLLKQVTALVVNAVLGIVALFIINFLHVMQWMGKPDLGWDLATVLVCLIGGLPGVVILMLLSILGIQI